MARVAEKSAWENAVTDPMTPVPFRILSRTTELADTFTLRLEPAPGMQGFGFTPGQFNMLYPFGVGEAPISISGDPDDPATLVHTIRSVGAVTRALEGLEPGGFVGVRGPFGNGWPVREAEGYDVVIVAGGLGLAPLRPAIHHLLTHRERYGNICIYYGARSPEEILYREQLERWRGRFDLNLNVTVDRAAPDWRGRVGVVTKLLGQQDFDPADTLALVCGPEIMMRFAIASLNELGVGNERIYLSMERNMKCALGFCGHCQIGPDFVCRDGPVFRYDRIAGRFNVREL